MSSHLNRADAGETPPASCAAASTIAYDRQGHIEVICRDSGNAPLVQDILIWCVLTSAIFALVKAFRR